MQKEKKRPTLEQLQEMDEVGLQLEVAQILEDFPADQRTPDWLLDSRLFDDLTPEKVIEYRQRATGCTEQGAQPDAQGGAQ